ncbi:MAG: ABC transporter permease [Parcubacteria group bacterium]|nr:ABC transporter permease [Parcubacteria group bacterium]
MLTFLRIIKNGFQDFSRNIWLTVSAVLIMTLTIFVLGGLLFLSAIGENVLTELQDKIDISVYFATETTESDILKVKKDLEGLNEVKNIEYVSRETALSKFKNRHADNKVILDSLDELSANPLSASLNIKAKFSDQYSKIASYLKSDRFSKIIDKINFYQNQAVIERFNEIMASLRKFGLLLTAALASVAILVAFNNLQLIIYTKREEIGIMRLVGASNWFIRGPFILLGLFYGVVASVIASAVFYPILSFASPRLSALLPSFNILSYYLGNFWQIFPIFLGIGTGLGILSGLIAIRRYLRV